MLIWDSSKPTLYVVPPFDEKMNQLDWMGKVRLSRLLFTLQVLRWDLISDLSKRSYEVPRHDTLALMESSVITLWCGEPRTKITGLWLRWLSWINPEGLMSDFIQGLIITAVRSEVLVKVKWQLGRPAPFEGGGEMALPNDRRLCVNAWAF